VAGLEAGADDYVNQAFVAKELGARHSGRCCAGRRPRRGTSPTVLTFGDLEVLPTRGLLRHIDGEEVHCTRTEFRLLCELAANPTRC